MGKRRIGGEDPLIRGIGPKSDPKDIEKVVRAIEKGIEQGEIGGARKEALKAWMKVAKRGFKYGGLIWLVLDELFIDVAEAGETPEELEQPSKLREINPKVKE